MNKLKTANKLLLLLILSFITFSCSKTDDPEPLGDYENGYFIVNEGNFGTGIGTLTFVDENQTVTQDIYQTVNAEPMGNTLQSMAFYGDNAYLVLNGSHKVIVTNRYTMEKIAVIEGENINNPRHFVAIADKGYVSNWGEGADPSDDFISVINLATNTIENTISIGEGPEKMLINDAKLYVNLQGGWGQNNQVAIIDMQNDTVVSNIEVGYVPNAITIDNNNDIWVLCGGKSWGGETEGRLIKLTNDTIAGSFDFNTTEHPKHLTINTAKNNLYYNLNNKVYSQSIDATTSSEELGFDGDYYGMTIKNDKLYTLDAGDLLAKAP